MGMLKLPEHHNLVWFRASDGFLISSFMVTRDYKREKEILDIPVLLQIHGLLGNFLSRGTPRLLPHALFKRGFSSLSINTRLAFAGQMTSTGIFDDTIYDIDAAVGFLAREGFRNIFILGYSLGASMLVNWAAKRNHANVRALILEGLHYSLPDTKRKVFEKWGSSPSYDEVYGMAKAVLGADPYNSPRDETIAVYRCTGPSMEPLHDEVYTFKSWWFMIGPEAHNAMSYRQMGRVKLPALIIRGESDFLTEEWEPGELARIAREGGNRHVRVREIPNARHECMENADAMLDEIVDMISAYSKD